MKSKSDPIKTFFEEPQKYLSRRQFDIRIRRETVQEFLNAVEFDRILDIGCGDGSISLPLLKKNTRITFLDISHNMLAILRSKIPAELSMNVETSGEDFMAAQFGSTSFDLILCLGVLAHVECPSRFIGRIASLLRPGGILILEATDSHHFVGRLVTLWHKLLKVEKRIGYSLSLLSNKEVVEMVKRHGFELRAIYRYSLPPPGTHRILPQIALYRLVRLVFGTSRCNRNEWLGNEYIYLLKKSGYT